MRDITLKEHLIELRKKAHATQIKNGHFFRMSALARKKLKKDKKK